MATSSEPAQTILITGATGLLGCALTPYLRAAGHQVISHGHRQAADINLDLSDALACEQMLQQVQPEVLINLAAYTDVDGCQRDVQTAYMQNLRPVENLVTAIKRHSKNCHLIQISTDQVYDGNGAQSEQQIIIRNVYALSKIAAESVAMQSSASVLRTNFFGKSLRPGRISFTDWLYQALKRQTPINVFDDIYFSPLSINSLCAQIGNVVNKKPQGIFNLGSRGGISKADFAFAFANALDLPTHTMQRTNSQAQSGNEQSGNPARAPRPKDMRMDVSLFERALNVQLPQLADEILAMRRDYLETP